MIRNLIQKLLPILEQEHQLKEQLKQLKPEKDKLLNEILDVLDVDSFTTDQVSIYKQYKYEVEEVDPVKAQAFKVAKPEWDMDTIKNLVEITGGTQPLEGIKVTKTPEIRIRYKSI